MKNSFITAMDTEIDSRYCKWFNPPDYTVFYLMWKCSYVAQRIATLISFSNYTRMEKKEKPPNYKQQKISSKSVLLVKVFLCDFLGLLDTSKFLLPWLLVYVSITRISIKQPFTPPLHGVERFTFQSFIAMIAQTGCRTRRTAASSTILTAKSGSTSTGKQTNK